MKTIVGSFDSFDEAKQVAQELMDSGFRDSDVSVIANNASGQYGNAPLTTDGGGLTDTRVGDRDVVHPVATVRQTADRIGAQLRVMPGMSHWLIGEEGWEEVAEIALSWLETDAQVAAA